MNKPNLLDKIKQLDTLSNDEKAYLVNLVNTKKKYGLVWEDKTEDVEEQLRTHLPVLKEVVERRIISEPGFTGLKDSPDSKKSKPLQTSLFGETENQGNQENPKNHGSDNVAPNHILIEGDNLHALTALTFTHEGAIDVIYIDPPYNTGNKDFKYNDSFVDREDSYRHSKWLSFMHKRLEIAKRLLSDKGVIFISIDDNEQGQLKLLCDEVFRDENFIEIFSWVRTETPARLSKKSIKVIEYVICYQKTYNAPNFKGFKSKSTSSNTLLNKPNTYKSLIFPDNIVDTGLNDGIYKKGKYGTSSYNIVLEEDTEVRNGCFIRPIVLSANFRWGQEKLLDEITNGTKISIRTSTFSPSYEKSDYEAGAPKNLINREVNVFTNEFARRELEELDIKFFDYPKPISLVKYLLSFTQSKSQIILDFFAGSGTTLHATMKLNAEDGGNRQCILVTNNENNIAEEVCYERNKRVIEGYTNSKGLEVPGLAGNNLRYYKTTLLGREPSLKNKRELTHLATELLCIKEDCYTDITTELGEQNWHKLFSNEKEKYVYVVYDDLFIEDAVDALKNFINKNQEAKIKVYVFANGQYAYAEEFEDIAENITLAALPDAIYKAYQNVLPKENKDFIPVLEDETSVEPQMDAE